MPNPRVAIILGRGEYVEAVNPIRCFEVQESSWRGKMQQADTISYHKIARWMDVLTVEFFASTGFV